VSDPVSLFIAIFTHLILMKSFAVLCFSIE
jgi:hypothetical protein